MADIEVFRARNTTGLAINGMRVTNTKPYGLIQTIQLFKCKDENIIEALGTDVQPAKRGRWIGIYEYCEKNGYVPSGMGIYYWCSECDKAEQKTSDFCPNCGARMDGEAE